ncbi:cytochrome b/b6 domain-containing protein [Gynuella sp.]|uniref:cytochrome b/b6 domain-containing protein n=1 Tax=Gynuella sp. TaxID=2969146 RepID=UPI003D0C3E81
MTKVWDPSIRIFHWATVAIIGGLWYTGEQGGDLIYLHQTLGFSLAALVLYRIIWGFWGSRYARFREFVRGPGTILSYLPSMFRRNDGHRHLSHNPMGGIAVLTILGLILAQLITGMMSTDDIMFDGPFVSLVSSDISDIARDLHGWIFAILQIVVVIHVLAVVWHQRFKGEPLIQSMIHGSKPYEGEHARFSALRAIIAIVLAAGISQFIIRFFGDVSIAF